MTVFEALEKSIELGMTNVTTFEAIFSGKFLVEKGKDVDKSKEFLCLIDMTKRKITVLGENPNTPD